MADADIGHLCKFQRDTGAAYATVGQVIAMTPPNVSRETTEATHFESTDRFEEYVSAMRDPGEAQFTIQFSDPASLDAPYTDIKSDAAVNYKLVWNDTAATEWIFAGFITAVTIDTPLKDRMTAQVSLKLTGKPAFLV